VDRRLSRLRYQQNRSRRARPDLLSEGWELDRVPAAHALCGAVNKPRIERIQRIESVKFVQSVAYSNLWLGFGRQSPIYPRLRYRKQAVPPATCGNHRTIGLR
jgi:hypothetical protein